MVTVMPEPADTVAPLSLEPVMTTETELSIKARAGEMLDMVGLPFAVALDVKVWGRQQQLFTEDNLLLALTVVVPTPTKDIFPVLGADAGGRPV